MNAACRNISPYSGRLCGDEHMETWIIALLQHATTADLQGSQGGSHVIAPKNYNEQPTQPHFYVGVPSKKNFDSCGLSPYIIGYSILIHQAIIAVRSL